jgi:alkylation response protein AidB-like acyl-CoA dehydrogenase
MDSTLTNNATRGRAQLIAWEASKPRDFYSADANLQAVLRRYLGARYAEFEERLRAFGGVCASVIDEAARVEDRIGNHPRLQRWSPIGERTEAVEFHPHHDRNGREVWNAGIMALQAQPGNTVAQMGLYYLLGQNGEGGHMCSLACTSGLIRALQQVGDPALQTKFLPPLLTPDYARMQHGAQLLTEVQGGSDVGANAIRARDAGDGTWRITGEKWFCSNINADQFLMTARPVEAAEGTRGLGLFVVPRTLDDGTTNGFAIRRLKDKLGTRTLASAEVDFDEAVAYPLGALDRGFKNVVELVLNTSRLMNAVGCAGGMRRAWVEASSYACHREAFGSAILSYPLVQEAIAEIMTETQAAVASTFYIAHLLDGIETGAGDDETQALYRLLVNVNKYLTSIRLTEVVHRAIEVFGGNGAIESFSVLPRLYRDAIVYESWEGTHNVLALQVLRDIARYDLFTPFTRMIRRELEAAAHLHEDAAVISEALDRSEAKLRRLASVGGHYVEAHARRISEGIGVIAQATLLLAEAEWEMGEGVPSPKAEIVRTFVNRRLRPGYDPMEDEGYLERLRRLAGR